MKAIYKDHAVIDQELVDKYVAMKDVYSLTAVVSDSMERDNIMRNGIKPRTINERIIGPALTVKLTPGDIVDCLIVFDMAQPGDIVVIDAFSEIETSVWGGLMSGLAKAAGIVGVVIDGSARDTDEARMLGFPIYSRYVGPRAAHSAYDNRFEPIEVNTPISCGGVLVKPGDLVIADELGVTVVPQEDMADVYVKAKAQAEKEELTRKDILSGMSYKDLLDKYGRI